MPKIATSFRRMPVSCNRPGSFAELYRRSRKLREFGRLGIVRTFDGRMVVGFCT